MTKGFEIIIAKYICSRDADEMMSEIYPLCFSKKREIIFAQNKKMNEKKNYYLYLYKFVGRLRGVFFKKRFTVFLKKKTIDSSNRYIMCMFRYILCCCWDILRVFSYNIFKEKTRQVSYPWMLY
jgi:hypothetical protein